MCVIIHREPNIEIPYDKIRSACKVNADGFGFAVVDRGRLVLRRVFEAKGNNPEAVMKLMEDAKAHDIYIHLRYKTRGATDLSNVHPFTVLKQKKHDMDVQFMHNGTMAGFGNQAECDSKDFAQTILTPLMDKLRWGVGEEHLLSDPTLKTILTKYAGSTSVFLLTDNFGNNLKINEDNGVDFDGWWASNEYSFNAYHREPAKAVTNTRGWVQGKGWEKDPEDKLPDSNTTSVVPFADYDLPVVKGGDRELPFNDGLPASMVKGKPPVIPPRHTFLDAASISSLKEVANFTRAQIEDLIEEYPEHATLLIMDLLKELYDRESDDMEYAE